MKRCEYCDTPTTPALLATGEPYDDCTNERCPAAEVEDILIDAEDTADTLTIPQLTATLHAFTLRSPKHMLALRHAMEFRETMRAKLDVLRAAGVTTEELMRGAEQEALRIWSQQ
jgi:hypothetical protein